MKKPLKNIVILLCMCMICGCSPQKNQSQEQSGGMIVNGNPLITDQEYYDPRNPNEISKDFDNLPTAKAIETNEGMKDSFKLEYLKLEAFQQLDISSITFALRDRYSYEWVIKDEKAFKELKQWAKEIEFNEDQINSQLKGFAMQIETKRGEKLNLIGSREFLVGDGEITSYNSKTDLLSVMEKYSEDKYRIKNFGSETKFKTGDWTAVTDLQINIDQQMMDAFDNSNQILPVSSIYNIKKTNNSNELKYSFGFSDLKRDELQNLDIKSIVVVNKEKNIYEEWIITDLEAFEMFKQWAKEVTEGKPSGYKGVDYVVQVNTEEVNGALVFGGKYNNVLEANGDFISLSIDIISLLNQYKDSVRQVRKPNLDVLMDTKNNYIDNLYYSSLDDYYECFDVDGVRQEAGSKNDEWKDALSMVFYLNDFNENNPIQDWTKISSGIAAQEIHAGYDIYGEIKNSWNQSHEFTIPDYARGGAPFTARLVPEEFIIEKGKEYFGDNFSLDQVLEGKHVGFTGYTISYVKPDQLFLIRTPYGGAGYRSANIFKIIHLEEEGNRRIYRGLLYFSESLETATNDDNERFDSIEGNKDKFRYVEISMEKLEQGIRIKSFKTLHDPTNGLYDESAWAIWDYVPENESDLDAVEDNVDGSKTFDDILNEYQRFQVSKIEYDIFDSKGIGYSYVIENQEDIDFVMKYLHQASLGYALKDALHGGTYSDYVVTLTDISGNKHIFELYEDVIYGQMISLNASDVRIQNYGPSIAFALNLKGNYVDKNDIYYLDHGAEKKRVLRTVEECIAQLNLSGDLYTLLENPSMPSILLNKRESLWRKDDIAEIDQLLAKTNIEPGRHQYGNTCLIYNEDGTTEECNGYYATKAANLYLYAYGYNENNMLVSYYVVDNQFGYSSNYDNENQALRNFRYYPERYGFIKIDWDSTITVLQGTPYTTVDVSQIKQSFDSNRRISGGISLSDESGFKSILSQIMIDFELRNYTYEENDEYYSIMPVKNEYGEFGSNKFMIRKLDGRFMTDQTLAHNLFKITFDDLIGPKITEKGYQVCENDNQAGICAWIPVITEDDTLAGSDMHTTSFYINEGNLYVDVPVYRDGWLVNKFTVQVK